MKKILIAEDHMPVQKFISRKLQSDNFEIISVFDGKAALEMLPTTKVDLLITDLQMPNIDGVTLIKTVRANSEYKELPILVLSGLENDEILKAIDAGANSYLRKPFRADILCNEVLNILLTKKMVNNK